MQLNVSSLHVFLVFAFYSKLQLIICKFDFHNKKATTDACEIARPGRGEEEVEAGEDRRGAFAKPGAQGAAQPGLGAAAVRGHGPRVCFEGFLGTNVVTALYIL